jgi:RNA recognition motif-containing protein
VDDLMNERPHQIDDKEVEIYRSVPNQGRLIEKKGVKNLIVSQIKNKLSASDLKYYFRKYGSIHSIQMNDENNFCRIEFDE